MRARSIVILAAVLVALALQGCGGASDTDLVRAKVREFAHAAATRDYHRICADILAPALLTDLKGGGIGCVEAMTIAFAHVESPRLAVGNIAVNGSRATALTISQASGQKTVLSTLRLIRTGAGWRISALGSPVK